MRRKKKTGHVIKIQNNVKCGNRKLASSTILSADLRNLGMSASRAAYFGIVVCNYQPLEGVTFYGQPLAGEQFACTDEYNH